METRDTSAGPRPDRESYGKVLANLGGMLVALGLVGYLVLSTGRPPRTHEHIAQVPPKADVPAPPQEISVPSPPKPKRPKSPAPVARVPELDKEAVAAAEQELDALSRNRARAEARADDAAKRLADSAAQAALDAKSSKTLAFRVRDPGTKLRQAAARGGFLKGERDKLAREVTTLSKAPRPRAKVLTNKNPVAKPADGDESHFEIRQNRISYIDLDRLISLVKADAQVRIRLSDGARVVDNQVGPVGAFSLHYILGRSLPAGLDELMERRGSMSYDLQGWEVVPIFDGRGETFEQTRQPFSEFARVMNRLSPARATITVWVYPDGFSLFRKLRDDLHARGYTVAARPLPDGMTIRGSPSGSISAGQ